MPQAMSQLTSLSTRFLAFAALSTSLICQNARALPESEVTNKLDTILMLMSVDRKGQPRAVKATVDGKQTDAYVGAMSISAAEEITSGKRYEVPKNEAKTLQFSPVSLAKFYQLLGGLLEKNPKRIGVIAPDPTQISTAEKLLAAQKVPASQAKEIANQQPMVFCPEPGILVSFNEGAEKGKQFVPCATEAAFVESVIERGTKESPQLAKTNPRVVAIPLNSFITYLRQEPAERVGQLRILPSGSLAKLVQELNAKNAQSKSSQ